MIDSILNLLFRCPHRSLTRPVSPITASGQPHSQAYVVCLDCGKQFEYDLKTMRVGKVIDRSHAAGIVPVGTPAPRERKAKFALLAALPGAVLLGAILKSRSKMGKPRVAGCTPPAAANRAVPGEPRASAPQGDR